MNKSNKFSPEVRERAVRLVQEHRGEYPSLWAAVESIAPKIGCVPQTLLEWVKRVDAERTLDLGGCGGNLGLGYAVSPRLSRYSRGLSEPREILIRFSLYQWM